MASMKRINLINGISDEEIDNTISLLEKYFHFNTKESLVKDKYFKTDSISTIELYILASSILDCDKKNHNWLERHIKIIEGNNINNARGSLWEIIFAGILLQSGLNVTLEKDSNPGIDISAIIRNNKINFSLKRFDKSTKVNELEKLFEEIEDITKVSAFPMTGIDILLPKFPASDTKEKIKASINTLVQDNTSKSQIIQNEKYLIKFNNNINQFPEIDIFKELKSYKLLLVSELHENEKKNLYSKINEAIDNLIKFKKGGLNILAIHINSTAPIDALEKYVKNYYESHKETEIDGVLFYQPTMCVNKSIYGITHVFRYISNVNRDVKLSGSIPVFQVVTGNVSIHSQAPVINIGENKTIKLPEKYFLQKGLIYQNTIPKEQYSLGKIGNNLTVVPVIKQNEKLIGIVPKLLEKDELILI